MKTIVKKLISIILILVLGLTTEVANADFTFGEPTNPGPPINSSYHETSPSISTDGLELYFSSNRPGGYGRLDLWITTRATTKDDWGAPANLGSTVNSAADELYPSISADGLSLYFADGLWYESSPRPGGFGQTDIWVTNRETTDDDWSTPVNLGPTVNSSAFDCGPSISTDGLSLYFGSNRPGGSGGNDLRMTTRPTVSDPWDPPVNLGPTVNSSAHDVEPSISTDGLVLFFMSTRSGGSGSYDLLVTTRVSTDDDWGAPVNLGPTVNSSVIDVTPCIQADGANLFFMSERVSGYDTSDLRDLWQVSIFPIVDLNGDGIVDSADMCIMVDYWGTDETLCDIGPMPWGDGIVDVQDLIVLSEHLFEEIYPVELIGYWKLDEEEGDIAYNSIGNNYGILSGDPTWQPDSGQVAGALEFDGINDYVETGFVLDPAYGAFSVFAWIQGGAPGQVIISQSDGIGTGETWLGMDALGGNLMTGLRPPDTRSPTPPMVSDFVITDGQWHHIGIVVTAHGVRNLYADGMRVAADTQGVNLPSSNGGLYLGTDKNLDAGTLFSGLIDDIRIYNVALSAEEIAALAQ